MLLPIYFAILVVYVALKCRHDYKKAIALKLSASFVFIVSAFVNWHSKGFPDAYGGLILLGLVGGFIGDYFLDMKYVTNSKVKSDQFTFNGFYAFIISHFFNVLAMLIHFDGLDPISVILPSLAVSLSVSGAVVAAESICQVRYGAYKAISFAYGSLLMFITCLSVVSYNTSGQPCSLYMSLGLVSFLLSDLVLSQTFFGHGKNTSPFIVANYVFYYSAQWLIAQSIYERAPL